MQQCEIPVAPHQINRFRITKASSNNVPGVFVCCCCSCCCCNFCCCCCCTLPYPPPPTQVKDLECTTDRWGGGCRYSQIHVLGGWRGVDGHFARRLLSTHVQAEGFLSLVHLNTCTACICVYTSPVGGLTRCRLMTPSWQNSGPCWQVSGHSRGGEG